ncbi:MAG: DUF167 domain-containing protein [Candidatus Yonathbacteria bacterium]|nr:DUF167 domain-containing protein [Candidatus Yonathbacteria bacterium]
MYIHVHITPKAKKDSIEQIGELRYAVSVKEPAEKNRANERMCEIVAKHFSVSRSAVRIVNGHRSRSKLIEIKLKS